MFYKYLISDVQTVSMHKLLLKILMGAGGAFVLLFICISAISDFDLHVYFLDVGQGDAILMRLPTSELILVDGGPANTVLQEMAEVMPFYENTLDLVILTHPHADHINGLIDVMNRFEIKKLMLTGVSYGDPAYEKFMRLIAEKNIEMVFLNGNKDYRLGGGVLDIIYPFESIQGQKFQNVNNSSIVFRFLYGDFSIYMNGDMEFEGEEKILARGFDLSSGVYKAGHHGSKTSGMTELLDEIGAGAAVISCGVDNNFGHPHAETVIELQERGIDIYRTDINGRVEFVMERRGNISVNAER